MRRNCTRILFFLMFTISLVACKKDSDSFGPTITLSSPGENQFFNVNDVISVKASISDEVRITAVSIKLVDEQQRTSHKTLAVPVSSPSMTINTTYLLDNIHLESGIYYLLITATDGKNDSRLFRKIYIGAIPKVVEKVIVASAINTSQTNFYLIDSAFSSINFYKSFTGDYIGSSVSSYFQQAYMCGNYTGDLTGVKLVDNSIRFNVPASSSSLPYFTGFYANDQNSYVAGFDESIRGYNYAGNTIYNTSAETDFYVQHLCMNDDHLIAEEKHKTSATKKLAAFYPSGTPMQSISINQDIVAFCEKDKSNVFLFGNSSGQGLIQLYDRINNNLWNPYPYSLATGTILSAVKIDPNTYLIGHSNGTIYKYNYQNPGITTYLTGYTAIQLRYDPESNDLFIAEANRISRFEYSSASLINSLNSTETVLDIHLLYNR